MCSSRSSPSPFHVLATIPIAHNAVPTLVVISGGVASCVRHRYQEQRGIVALSSRALTGRAPGNA
eukprot:3706805-Lingulodinium_polyedra.AAC.1